MYFKTTYYEAEEKGELLMSELLMSIILIQGESLW